MTVYIRGTSFDSVILIIFSMLWIVCIHWTPTSKWGMDLWSRLRMPQWMWTCTFRFSSDTVQVGCIIQSINSHFFIKLLPMQAFLPRRVIVHICVCFWMTGRKVIVISSFCFLLTFLKKKKSILRVLGHTGLLRVLCAWHQLNIAFKKLMCIRWHRK